ncbi:MAG: hypothetical protein E7675_03550 [Ruminococcaceae bacterium]|nr:hypothetical protein [Oscillospiraceae bacterium]
MINIKEKIYDRIKSIIKTWDEEEIYAISFYVNSNECCEYGDFYNLTEFAISYNTESDCNGVKTNTEERWNYAFWRQDEEFIIDPRDPDELTHLLFKWYEENGITELGYEDPDRDPEEDTGPVGFYEVLNIASDVARQLQEEGFIEEHFGKKLPIIVHGLEYAWYDIEATENANPNGEAKDFMQWIDNGMV